MPSSTFLFTALFQVHKQDEARRLEVAGEWQEALTYHEHQLSGQENNSDAHSGRLRCLWGLGYVKVGEFSVCFSLTRSFHFLKSMPHGLQEVLWESQRAAKNDALTEDLRSNGAAAAWRLGDWESVESFVSAMGEARPTFVHRVCLFDLSIAFIFV